MLEALGKIGFDWQVALANLINFLIIFFILKHFAFKPIQKVIKERREKIEQGLEDAQRAQTALLSAEAQKDKILSDASKKSHEVFLDAENQKNAIVNEAKTIAENEAGVILADAQEQMLKERQKMESDIKRKSVELVVEGLSKVLKKEINEKENERLTKNILTT